MIENHKHIKDDSPEIYHENGRAFGPEQKEKQEKYIERT
jgi:hypothetical protein